MYKYIKAVAAFLGGLSPLALAGILAVLRVPVDPATAVTWAAVAAGPLSLAATYFAPANAAEKAAEDAEAAKLGTAGDGALAALGARLAPKP